MLRSVLRSSAALRPAALGAATRRAAMAHVGRPATRGPALALAAAHRTPGRAQQHVRFYSPITADEPAKQLAFDDVQKLVDGPTASVAASPDSAAPLLVDVREPSEYNEGHIPTAVNIPFKSSPGALGLEPDDFEDAFGFPKPPVDKELVFYCLGGVRSTAAEELAGTFGYQK